ncbi:MAG: TIGR04086 family membrane protein [Bacillota bacterium]|nr:TIGR04086 family membrane protein [Bacillota bacterium]
MKALEKETASGSKLKALCIGLSASAMGMLLLSLLLSLIVYFSPLSDLHMDKLAIAINGFSILLGAFLAGHFSREKGLLLGIGTAALLSLLLLLLNDGSSFTGLKLAVNLTAGAVGGVVGVH